MDKKQWGQRISRRSDFATRIVHLTKPTKEDSALDILIKILKEGTLKASKDGYICGKDPVVCFQDVPLQSLSENIFYEQELRIVEKQSLKYKPFGLRFSKQYLYNAGGRPVFYENTEVAKSILPESEHWRIVRFNLSNDKNFIDWTHEREWRIKGDLHFELKDVEILLSEDYSLAEFLICCEEVGLTQVAKEVKGIISLQSIIF